MTWIRTIGEDDATGTVAKYYAASQRSWGGVDNVIKSVSLNASALRSMMTFYNGVMHGDGELTLGQREMIALTVSALNECQY